MGGGKKIKKIPSTRYKKNIYTYSTLTTQLLKINLLWSMDSIYIYRLDYETFLHVQFFSGQTIFSGLDEGRVDVPVI